MKYTWDDYFIGLWLSLPVCFTHNEFDAPDRVHISRKRHEKAVRAKQTQQMSVVSVLSTVFLKFIAPLKFPSCSQNVKRSTVYKQSEGERKPHVLDLAVFDEWL